MQPRRQHLLETAQRLFNEQGFHATGIDLILAESGVSKATLYKYFAGKEDLIIAVLRQRHAQVVEYFNDAVTNARSAGKSPVLGIFDALDTWFNSEDFYGCSFINSSAEYSAQDDPIHKLASQHKAEMEQIIRNSLDAFKGKEKIRLAEEISLLVEGAIVRAHTRGDKQAAKIARRMAIELLRTA